MEERLLARLLLSGSYGPGSMPVRVVGWDDASLTGRPVTVVYYETRDGAATCAPIRATAVGSPTWMRVPARS